MSLISKLKVDTKSAWVEYPGLRGFEIEIANLSRPQVVNLRKSCLIQKFDRKTRQPIEELDEDKFVAKFTEATIKNWKGFKKAYLEHFMTANLDGENLEEDIPYSKEDAEALVLNSAEFDQWLNEAVFDLDNFRSGAKGAAVGEADEVAE